MANLRDYVERELTQGVVAITPIGGGDVAESFRVSLADGRTVFAKTHRHPPPGFFTTEAAGLAWLRDAGAVAVPEVLAVSDDPPALVLEWVEVGRAAASTEAALGRSLARLHATGAPSFGREDRRSTGSRGLPNEPHATWAEAYAVNRLLPLAKLARDGDALPGEAIRDLESVASRLPKLGGPVSLRRVCTATCGRAIASSTPGAAAGSSIRRPTAAIASSTWR